VLLPKALPPQDVLPARSLETARDLAARHNRELLPKALTPQDVRPARFHRKNLFHVAGEFRHFV
jgi:hypothetical protein